MDTNIILDVITDDPAFGASSERLLDRMDRTGSLVISEIVYAELVPQYASKDELDAALDFMRIRLVDSGADVAHLAGAKWARYRASGGSRSRVLPDFMIGAHASIHGDCLLTRDRGFYATYFPELRLFER